MNSMQKINIYDEDAKVIRQTAQELEISVPETVKMFVKFVEDAANAMYVNNKEKGNKCL